MLYIKKNNIGITMSNISEKRSVKSAIKLGFTLRCPNCSNKTLFKSYLKTHHHCVSCQEEFYHHRADDGPAYLTILVVGHLIVPFIHIFYSYLHFSSMMMAITLSIMATIMSLYLLPRFKGMIVGIQWANYMGGFDPKIEKSKPS